MSNQYDVIIIGAGHNGLVTAVYLSKAGRKVLVLEKRDIIGGAAATEEIFPGFKGNTGASDAGLFMPEIVSELKLAQHGLAFIENEPAVHALQAAGAPLTLWRDLDKSVAEIGRFSKQDAQKYPAFVDQVCRYAEILKAMMRKTPPTLPKYRLQELLPWAGVALKLRRLGGSEMMDFMRVLPMSISEYLDEWFETPLLKGALGLSGVMGTMQGPMAAGTALMLLYNAIGSSPGAVRASRFVRGGTGALSQALAAAAASYGVELRTSAGVRNILLADDKISGVRLENGEVINAEIVISSIPPRQTFFELIGSRELEIDFVQAVKHIKYQGSTARLNLALAQLPQFTGSEDVAALGGHIVICPSLPYLEKAYDAAKYGRFSPNLCLDMVISTLSDPALAPDGNHLMSIDIRYTPYALRGTDWESEHPRLMQQIIDLLTGYIPHLEEIILHRQLITPADYEREYNLPEGHIFHGQMGLDQLMMMRPVGGYARYQTPIQNLYLCGAGAHPGGGVTGAPGYNAAQAVLRQ
ncbi:MAG: NAD(P)/FAD-dependent oxidoreductase [Chloroflexi bacterium]|nr:NAD(P)/FAD-dependent oxidoreductase [Chloroflexota bacterium]